MLELLQPVAVEPDETAARIRQYARENPDLHEDYDGPDGTVYGLCYPLSEAYFHARGGKTSGLEVYCLSWSDVDPGYDGTHWYLRDDRRALSSSVIRGWLFARGVPVLALIGGFAATWPLFGPYVALLAALVVGGGARVGTLAWQASKYRFVEFADRDPGASEVIVETFTLEDADGVPIYVARVDGHELAHRDQDALADIVVREVRERLGSGEHRPSFAHYYYDEAVSHGHVDIQFVADEYNADIKTRVKAALREADGELEVERLDDEMCEEYAEAAYRRAIRTLVTRGELDVRRGEYKLH